MAKQTYKQLLAEIKRQITALEDKRGLSYLLPDEIETLQNSPAVPDSSAAYFNRSQAIRILKKYRLGVYLQWRFKAQSALRKEAPRKG